MPHLSGELFKMMTAIELAHIPYKGTGAVFTDLIAGRMQVLFGDIVATYPHVQGGRLRALGVTSPQRIAQLADIPTIAESGLTGYAFEPFYAIVVPPRTPREGDDRTVFVKGFDRYAEGGEEGIRNGLAANHPKVDVPASRLKTDIAKILKDEGYIANYKLTEEGSRKSIRIYLKYTTGNVPALACVDAS